MKHFKEKVDAGADSAITQYFFNADAYERFLEDCARLNVQIPIVPGIMPITNYSRLARFSKMCGADMPKWIFKRVRAWEEAGDSKSIRRFGEEVVTDLCRKLLDLGAPGIHFYTLNRAQATLKLCSNLGLGDGCEAEAIRAQTSPEPGKPPQLRGLLSIISSRRTWKSG